MGFQQSPGPRAAASTLPSSSRSLAAYNARRMLDCMPCLCIQMPYCAVDTKYKYRLPHYSHKVCCNPSTGTNRTQGCLAADEDTSTGACKAANLDTGVDSCAVVADVQSALYGGFRFSSRLFQVPPPHGRGGGLSLLTAGLLWGGQHRGGLQVVKEVAIVCRTNTLREKRSCCSEFRRPRSAGEELGGQGGEPHGGIK